MRLGRWLCMSAVLVSPALVGGCYTYSTYESDRPAATMIEIEATLNDRGRVAMENRIGPEVLSVIGTVTSIEDSAFTIRMIRVMDINRTVSHWAGETVRFELAHIRGMRERRLNRSRTVVMVGGLSAGMLAMTLGRSIFGWATGDVSPVPGDPVDN